MMVAVGLGFQAVSASASVLKPAVGAEYSQGRLHNSQWFTCFSTQGDCTPILLHAINLARKSIFVQAYELGSKSIVQALLAAKQRGVNVQVILDKHKRECGQTALSPRANAAKPPDQTPTEADPAPGLSARWDSFHDSVYHESLVLDGGEVIEVFLGTHRSPDSCGVDHLLAIHDRGLAKVFIENWRLHAKHAGLGPGP